MIRPAVPADLSELVTLISALAAHHKDASSVTAATLTRDLFGPHPWLQMLVSNDHGLQGYLALTQLARLQWGQRGMDVHHLFVAPHQRGKGIGRALIAAAIATARAQDCSYLTVSALPTNAAAQNFYTKLGFHPASDRGIRFALNLSENKT